MNQYFLMDLERTIASGVPCYWKRNKHGYTYEITQAGIFFKDEAYEIVRSDSNQRTVYVPYSLIFDLGLKKLFENQNDLEE